jgi:hypothetical protein
METFAGSRIRRVFRSFLCSEFNFLTFIHTTSPPPPTPHAITRDGKCSAYGALKMPLRWARGKFTRGNGRKILSDNSIKILGSARVQESSTSQETNQGRDFPRLQRTFTRKIPTHPKARRSRLIFFFFPPRK